MRFTLTIETGNAATVDDDGTINTLEIGRILRSTAARIDYGDLPEKRGDYFRVNDYNGNPCATFKRTQ